MSKSLDNNSVELFVWDAKKDQEYTTDYGSQELTDAGFNWNKYCGYNFTMNAEDNTLTLHGDLTNTSSNRTYWPPKIDSCESGRHSTVSIKNGTFELLDVVDINFGGANPAYPELLQIDVFNQAKFTVKALSQIIFSSSHANTMSGQSLVTIKDYGTFDVEAVGVSIPSGIIEVKDHAVMNITANLITDGHIIVESGESPCLKLGAGQAKVNFMPLAPDFLPFDFAENTYPKGLFFFDTTVDKDNQGTFVFHAEGHSKKYNAFQFSAMVAKGLISVNGRTDSQMVSKNIGYKLDVDGTMTIGLKKHVN